MLETRLYSASTFQLWNSDRLQNVLTPSILAYFRLVHPFCLIGKNPSSVLLKCNSTYRYLTINQSSCVTRLKDLHLHTLRNFIRKLHKFPRSEMWYLSNSHKYVLNLLTLHSNYFTHYHRA